MNHGIMDRSIVGYDIISCDIFSHEIFGCDIFGHEIFGCDIMDSCLLRIRLSSGICPDSFA